MAKITNVSPIGDLDVPLLGRIVHAGETVEVTDDQAATLAAQASNWQTVDDTPAATAAVETPAASDAAGSSSTATAEATSTAADAGTAADSAAAPAADAAASTEPTDTTSTEGSEH